MDIPTTSPIFTQANDMNAICNPLFGGSDVGFFAYSRYYPDNTMMLLSTYPKWSKGILEKKCATDRERIESIMATSEVNFLHDTFYYLLQENNPEANALGKQNNIDSTIAIIDQQADYLEGFVFASNNMVPRVYL